jgi:hypothetical protein
LDLGWQNADPFPFQTYKGTLKMALPQAISDELTKKVNFKLRTLGLAPVIDWDDLKRKAESEISVSDTWLITFPEEYGGTHDETVSILNAMLGNDVWQPMWYNDDRSDYEPVDILSFRDDCVSPDAAFVVDSKELAAKAMVCIEGAQAKKHVPLDLSDYPYATVFKTYAHMAARLFAAHMRAFRITNGL